MNTNQKQTVVKSLTDIDSNELPIIRSQSARKLKSSRIIPLQPSVSESQILIIATETAPPENAPELQILSDDNCDILKKNLLKLFTEADLDHNELIDFQEFSAAIKKLMPNQTLAETEKLFTAFDTNNTQNISLQDLMSTESFNRFLNKLGFIRQSSSVSKLRSKKKKITFNKNVFKNKQISINSSGSSFGSSSGSSSIRTSSEISSMSKSKQPDFVRGFGSITLSDVYAQHSILAHIAMNDQKDKEIMKHEVCVYLRTLLFAL